MPVVEACSLPDDALLQSYVEQQAYTDCYRIDIAREIELPRYVSAFYTTPVFRLERLILKLLFARPSSDAQAESLARAASQEFAAWFAEARNSNQLLMCDFHGRTRSWFMVEPLTAGRSRLYFGSAITPVAHSGSGRPGIGPGFKLLLGFHRLYSRILLRAAAARLRAEIVVDSA